MKKVLASVFLILICYFGYGQFGITQNLGSSSTLVNVPANGGLRAGLINRVFTDTTSANLSQLDFYDGAQIKTLSPINAVWWRDSTNAKWIQILPAGGTIGAFAWNVGGNSFFPAASGNFIFGIGATTTGNYGIDFRTKNTTRFILDSNGIGAYSASVIPLGYDSVSKKLSRASSGASSTPTWQQTLIAGSILSQDNVINSSGYNFKLEDVKELELSTVGTGNFIYNQAATGSISSSTQIYPDSILIRPFNGHLEIDTLLASNEASDSMMVWTKSGTNTGKVGYRAIPSGSGGTVTSVATGLGLSGGPITTTGTVFVDTASAVILSRQRAATTYAPIASPTFTGTLTAPTINVSGLTASQLVATDASKNLQSLSTSTYPSLTELSYVKGVTSALQTQIDAQLPRVGATYTTTTGEGLALTSSTLTSGSLLSLKSSSTAAAGNSQAALIDSVYGANSTSSQTTYAARFFNKHTGTGSVNVGIYSEVSGGGVNYNLVLSEPGGNYNNNGFAFDNNSITISSSGVKRYVSAAVDIMPSTGIYKWVSGTTNPFGTTDLTLSRNAAGVLQVGTSAANASGTVFAAKYQVATSVFWSSGTGSPEGVLTANIGSLYSRTDGGAGTSLYVKESGTGNTGWVAK